MSMKKEIEKEKLLTERAAAAFLGLGIRTLQAWRVRGKPGLPFVRLSRRAIRYRRSDIEAFVRKCLRISTSDPRKEKKQESKQ